MCSTLSITMKLNTKSRGTIATSRRWPKSVNLYLLLAVASSLITRKTIKVTTAARPKEAVRSPVVAGLTVVTRVEITIIFHINGVIKTLSNLFYVGGGMPEKDSYFHYRWNLMN